jgi:hypothetical protein
MNAYDKAVDDNALLAKGIDIMMEVMKAGLHRRPVTKQAVRCADVHESSVWRMKTVSAE